MFGDLGTTREQCGGGKQLKSLKRLNFKDTTFGEELFYDRESLLCTKQSTWLLAECF